MNLRPCQLCWVVEFTPIMINELRLANPCATLQLTSLAGLQDQSRLFREHPDIAALSPGRIGTRFLELRGMGIDNEVILMALLTAPVLFA